MKKNYIGLMEHKQHLFFDSYKPYQPLTKENCTSTEEYGHHMLDVLHKNLGSGAGSVCRPELFTTPRVGGDPEFFIEQGKFVKPSYEWLGTPPESHDNFSFFTIKDVMPKPALKHPDNFEYLISDDARVSHNWLHPDGIQLEFGYAPDQCMEVTSQRIASLFKQTKTALSKDKLTLSKETSKEITEHMAYAVPLGCRPSFNAHDIDNMIVNKNPLKRFTGGHFHFSVLAQPYQRDIYIGENVYFYNPMDLEIFGNIYSLKNLNDDIRRTYFNPIVKAMDATMGILSVAMAGDLDDPERRHHHYGMAGDYRLTKQTLEYRVPSNAMWFNSVTWHILGMMGRELVRQHTGYIAQDNIMKEFNASIKDWGEVTDIINNTDYIEARKFWEKNKTKIYKLFSGVTSINCNQAKIDRLAANGIKSHLTLLTWNNHPSTNYPTTLTASAI